MRVIVATLFTLFVLSGCKDDPASSPPFVQATYQISAGQTIAIPGTAQSIRFDGVTYDGRLPAGRPDSTWWYNTARTRWTLYPSGVHLELYISGEVYDSIGYRFESAPAQIGNVSFQLFDLSPLPPELLQPPTTVYEAQIEVRPASLPADPGSDWLPMTTGNKWIYLDSSWENDSLLGVRLDTVWIETQVTDQNGCWHEWSGYIDPFGRTALIKGDTVYSQGYGYGPYDAGSPLYFVSRELRPPAGDSMQYQIIVEGDMISTRTAVRLPAPFSAPAGEFDNCLKFDALLAYTDATEILAPGIGFVYMGRTSHYSDTWSGTTHMWLQSYELH